MAKAKQKPKKKPSMHKMIYDITATMEDVSEKLDELNQLSKGSKLFVVLGWLLMSSGVASGAYIFNRISGWLMFVLMMVLVSLMMAGYSLAHKGLTGDWL